MTINKLSTTPAILEQLAKAPGVHNATKNFRKLTAALAVGNHNIIEILNNPVTLAGIPANQVRHIDTFLANNVIATKLQKEKRRSVMVATQDVSSTRWEGKKLVSTLPSDRLIAGVNVQFVSQNYVADKFDKSISAFDVWTVFGSSEKKSTRRVQDLRQLCYVDLHVQVPAEASKYEVAKALAEAAESATDEEYVRLLRKQRHMILHGFFKDGKHYRYAFRSPSQERQVQAVFVADMKLSEFFLMLGIDWRAFSKKKNELNTLDAIKRFGTMLSSSLGLPIVNFGAKLTKTNKGLLWDNGLYRVLIVPDRWYKNESNYRRFNPESKKFEKVDGKLFPRWEIVGDGQALYGEAIYNAIIAYFGKTANADASQFRISPNPNSKFFGVFQPGLEKVMGCDLMLTESCVKGMAIGDLEQSELRIVNFNRSLKTATDFINMPAAVVQTLPVTSSTLKAVLDEQFDMLRGLFSNHTAMLDYFNLNFIEDDEMTDEDAKSLQTTVAAFCKTAPFVSRDAYIKQLFLDMLEKRFDGWIGGNLPVRGRYTKIVQDPIAMMYAKYIKCENKWVVTRTILNEGEAFIRNKDGKAITEKFTVFANPTTGPGQVQNVTGVIKKAFLRDNRAYRNVIIVPAKGLLLPYASGRDCDGDDFGVVFQKQIVDAVDKDKAPRHVSFSCPSEYTDPNLDFSMFKFDVSNYDDELVETMHDTSKEYILRTLIKNKVGYLTDVQSKLGDALRVQTLNMVRASSDDLLVYEQRVFWLKTKQALLSAIIAWEIDRPKHGGFYEVYLKDELAFLTNPPSWLSEEIYPGGPRRIIMPTWLAHVRGKAGTNTGSTLCIIHDYVKSIWSDFQNMIDSYKDEIITGNKDKHTLMAELTSAIPIDKTTYDALAKEIRAIREDYRREISPLVQERIKLEESAKAEAASKGNNPKFALDEIALKYNAIFKAIVEDYAGQVSALENFYSDIHIGYVAYMETYVKLRKNRVLDDLTGEWTEYYTSPAFPWTVAKSQFWKATKFVAEGKFSNHNLFPTTPGSFRVAFAIPEISDSIKAETFAGKLKAKLESSDKVSVKQIKTDDSVYYGLFVDGVSRPVAYLLYDHINKMAGNKEADFIVDKVQFSNNSKFALHVTFA